MTSLDSFQQICRQNKWKCTVQRRTVYDYLNEHHCHPSVEMVWQAVREKLPDVSLDSIYRILGDFVSADVLRRLDSGKVYRYDVNVRPHDHFVCSECGSMFDFNYSEAGRINEQCREFGEITSFELEVRGICSACLASRQGNPPPAPQQG